MRAFTLHLQSATRYEHIEGVVSFVGQDPSGHFGILPGRAPLLTLLDYGLARYRTAEGGWEYVACPGGVLSFADDALILSTRRYLRDTDFTRVSARLTGELAREEAQLQTVKASLQRLEQELFRRLRRLERREI